MPATETKQTGNLLVPYLHPAWACFQMGTLPEWVVSSWFLAKKRPVFGGKRNLAVPSCPLVSFFGVVVFSGGCPFNPLKVKLLAGDLLFCLCFVRFGQPKKDRKDVRPHVHCSPNTQPEVPTSGAFASPSSAKGLGSFRGRGAFHADKKRHLMQHQDS